MDRTLFRIKHLLVSATLATALIVGGGTLAGIALGTTPAASAQDQPAAPPPGGGEHGHRMADALMSLNLNDDQKTQIRAIMADAHKQNQNVTDREVRHANMKAAMSKVETVLTPAQRTQLHAKMEAMRQDQSAHPQ